jgi:hypothetical protein
MPCQAFHFFRHGNVSRTSQTARQGNGDLTREHKITKSRVLCVHARFIWCTVTESLNNKRLKQQRTTTTQININNEGRDKTRQKVINITKLNNQRLKNDAYS